MFCKEKTTVHMGENVVYLKGTTQSVEHNSVPWDWHIYVKYSHIQFECGGKFRKIMLVAQNIVVDLNNVMKLCNSW